jgi:hypothetical protein
MNSACSVEVQVDMVVAEAETKVQWSVLHSDFNTLFCMNLLSRQVFFGPHPEPFLCSSYLIRPSGTFSLTSSALRAPSP